MDGGIKLGKYRHFKGGEYEVIGVATHSETLERYVVYKALYGDFGLWIRPEEMFFSETEVDGKRVKRFAYIEKARKSKTKKASEQLVHTFEPVYDKDSTVLILGTFPSVKSRENHFYYGHPQNRFWKVIAALTTSAVPNTIGEKKKLLLENNIAIYDVLKSCEITGSADSTIKNPKPNDIAGLIKNSKITKVFANGKTAYHLYMKYIYKDTGIKITELPSTSPANAAYGLDRLLVVWKQIFE